jgi:hypothetical protein
MHLHSKRHHDFSMTFKELPQTIKQWTVTGTTGFECLKIAEAPLPAFGDTQVLIKGEL